MVMESTMATWHNCVISHLDEWASVYIDVGGRCLHIALGLSSLGCCIDLVVLI
jgi:hypothetical protein